MVVNGDLLAQGSQFSLKDVEMVFAEIDLDAVWCKLLIEKIKAWVYIVKTCLFPVPKFLYSDFALPVTCMIQCMRHIH